MNLTKIIIILFSILFFSCEGSYYKYLKRRDQERKSTCLKDKNGNWVNNMCVQKTFLDYCQNRGIYGSDVLKTVDVLLEYTNEVNCLNASEKLNKESILNLDNEGLSNLYPLATLSSLKEISLKNNNISNILPLGSCKNLAKMNLEGNPIESVTSSSFNEDTCPIKYYSNFSFFPNDVVTQYCLDKKNNRHSEDI